MFSLADIIDKNSFIGGISKNIERIFVLVFMVFCLIPFAFDASALWIISFYGLLLPVFICYIVLFWPVTRPKIFESAILLLLFYLGLRSAFSGESMVEGAVYILRSLPLIFFCWLGTRFFTCDGRRLDLFIGLFVGAAVVMGMVKLIPHIIEAESWVFLISKRLEGPGLLSHPIRGVAVLALAAVLALWQAFRAKEWRWRILFYMGYIVLFAMVIFSQSRSLIFAVFLPSFIFALHGQRLKEQSKSTWLMAVFHSGLMVVVVASVFIFLGDKLLGRSVESRFDIWQQVWQQFTEMPIWGHGMANMLVLAPPVEHVNHAHNFYLSILYYGGFVGLCFFLLIVFITACTAFNQLNRELTIPMIAIFIFTQATIMTDTYKILGSPNEVWLYFWLPCCILVGQYRYWQQDWSLQE